MKRLLFLVFLSFFLLSLAVIGQNQPPAGNLQKQVQGEKQHSDEYVYRIFFDQVLFYINQSDEADRDGMNSSYLRSYFQKKLGISSEQALLLNQVAIDLSQSLAQYDAKARDLTNAQHVLFQKKRANKEPLPAPPAEVLALPAGRDVLVLQARDRLRSAFGEQEFSRLDKFVKAHVVPEDQPGTSGGATAPQNANGQSQIIPERLYYLSFFRAVTYFKTKAAEERALGLDKSADSLLSLVQHQAHLTDAQAQILDETITQFSQAIADWNTLVQPAQKAYKKACLDMLARDGIVTQTEELATLQKNLQEMTKQLDAIADNAIQRLHALYGDSEFARLDAFVKHKSNVSLKRVSPSEATPSQEVPR